MEQKTQQIRLELEGINSDDLTFLFGNANPNFGFKKKLSEDVEIENRTAPSFGIEPVSVITIFIKISSSIASSIAARYIYDWLKERFSKCHVNETLVKVDPGEIKKIIEQLHLNDNSIPKDSKSSEK